MDRTGAVTWAGVAWRERAFEVAVADHTGRQVAAPTTFTGGRLGDLVALLRRYADRATGGFAAIVDSTNGMVDGHLCAAGLRVYRADPWQLPDRPPFGSVPATALVACAVAGTALTEVTVATGSLAGRAEEYAAALARSAPVEQELSRAGRYLERGGAGVPLVAVTFDDGPHPAFTPAVLAILARYEVPATFFCVGLNAASHPDLVESVARAGHLLGNHTWSHPYLPDLSRDELLRQVDTTNEALARVTGSRPALFRPPYGSRTPEVLRWLAGHEMTTVVWDVDSRDWSAPGVPVIAGNVRGAARNGSVVLMHDGGGDRSQTVSALPGVLEELLARGHRFGTLHEVGGRA